MPIFRGFICAGVLAVVVATVREGAAQAPTIQFPHSGFPATGAITTPPAATAIPPSVTAPAFSGGAPAPAISPAPLGAPTTPPPLTFDPYSTAPNLSSPWPFSSPSSAGVGSPPALNSSPFGTVTPNPYGPPTSPFSSPSPGTLSPSPYATSPFGAPAPGAYPSQTPNAVFPNGLWSTDPNSPGYDFNQTLKLVQDLRLRQTYLGGGNDPTDLGINDTEVAVTFTVPNFLFTNQPVYISPAFGLHLWDGPADIAADLPPNAYDGYLDAQYQTDANLQFGAELGFRIGVYTDFKTLNSHSLRIQGLGLGRVRLTPTVTLKLGVMYLDRNRIKLLPAGGILWQPTPQTRFDFFFPQPKLASYLTTIGTYEVWWYVAGEYGGGAWTIQRAAGDSDRIDINDIRASIGLEWFGPRGLNGFGEVGFVFNREVFYVADQSDNFDPGNTFMLRAGLSY